MKPLRYHILLALADSPLHGAEIRRRAEDQSGGTLRLYPATLYGTLDELQASDWIEQIEPREAAVDQARWRFYGLTREGRLALEEETSRLEGVLSLARAALRDSPGR